MTPHWHSPSDPRIFVFGSNLRGIHGAGAALYAMRELGASLGVGHGPTGRCYAIPTCYSPGFPMPLEYIGDYVRNFLRYARDCELVHAPVRFFVSEVGCGYAGYTAKGIAPLFADAPANCDLPPGWRK